MRYEKNDEMENYLPKLGLQIISMTFFDKMYILYFDFKFKWRNLKSDFKYSKSKIPFLSKICEIENKR